MTVLSNIFLTVCRSDMSDTARGHKMGFKPHNFAVYQRLHGPLGNCRGPQVATDAVTLMNVFETLRAGVVQSV